MGKKNKNIAAKKFFSARRRYVRLTVYAVILLVLSFALAAQKNGYSIFLFAATVAFISFEIYHVRKSEYEFIDYVERLDFCMNSNARGTLLNYPAPLVITDMSGRISWYNDSFRNIFKEQELFDCSVHELIPELQISRFIEQDENCRINLQIGDNHYEVWGNISSDGVVRKDGLIVFYFIDKTGEVNAIRTREEERMVECIVIIDNYEEVLKETPDSNHGTLLGEIEQKVNGWLNLGNGILRKYEKDKFIVFFSEKNFARIMENKFELLNEVRNINHENKIPVTLSIGVGRFGADTVENDKFARLAIDMALGRGGDQVVIRDAENFTFYGAKTREVEKRTKVKARVVAHALRELVDHADKVIIMGHRNSDMDSIGASVGIFKAVHSRGREPYIVCDVETSNARQLIDTFRKIPEYENAFITDEQALNLYTNDTLIIVVDVHRPVMVECSELLVHAKNVVLIDHHRRSEDFIENAVLTYHEPYASSTSEMITEILQYIQDNGRLNQQEAEALYSGIFMDTKGFTVKTGVRTFEAASYLRRMGVNPVNVRRLFKTNYASYIAKADIIRRAQVYQGNIALSYLYEECPELSVTVAQAADELLDISGIEASFVLAASGSRILISGRSLDNINVQVILEKLGGGGHITIAGAQLQNVTMEEADNMLKKAIDEVMSE